jgi:hypothetical protein
VPLVVHLNGGELYDVEPADRSFETDRPFEVELRNHGQPVHVHLRVDDGLTGVASLAGPNHYVERESALRVPVDVAEGAPPTEGTLQVVTGYGKGSESVSVRVADDLEDDAVRTAVRTAASDAGDGTSREEGSSPLAALTGRLPAAERFGAVGRSPVAVVAAALSVLALGAGVVATSLGSGLAVVVAIFLGLAAVGTAAYAMVR